MEKIITYGFTPDTKETFQIIVDKVNVLVDGFNSIEYQSKLTDECVKILGNEFAELRQKNYRFYPTLEMEELRKENEDLKTKLNAQSEANKTLDMILDRVLSVNKKMREQLLDIAKKDPNYKQSQGL